MPTTVTHLTSVHGRFDDRIFTKECCSLAKAGYQVSLVVADGKGDATVDGIAIFDAGSSSGRLSRILNTTRKVLAIAKYLDSDIYHFHDPELIPVGARLKKLGKKVIYDIHEDVPTQILHKKYIYQPFRGLISKVFIYIQNYFARHFDALLVPQPCMEAQYNKIARTVLIENFSFIPIEQPATLDLYKSNPINIFHAGSITIDRGLINMLELATVLDNNDQFYLAGNIDSLLLDDIKQHPGWGKITYVGVIDSAEIKKYYGKSNLGVILYNNVDQYYLSYAVKLFEYMSYGIPVILPDFGEWVEFNLKNKCGINVAVDNKTQLIAAITYLRQNPEEAFHMGQSGRKAVEERYNWPLVERKLLALYDNLSGSGVVLPRIHRIDQIHSES